MIDWTEKIECRFSEAPATAAFIVGQYDDGGYSVGIEDPDKVFHGIVVHVDESGRSVNTGAQIIWNKEK